MGVIVMAVGSSRRVEGCGRVMSNMIPRFEDTAIDGSGHVDMLTCMTRQSCGRLSLRLL